MRWAQGLERPHAAENAEVVLESIRRGGIIFAEQRARISAEPARLGALAVFLAREHRVLVKTWVGVQTQERMAAKERSFF